MSSSNRTTLRGGKGPKGDSWKSHKHDKSDTGKGSGDKQHKASDSVKGKSEDPNITEKVRQIMEMTRRDENEVCLALHECDMDTELAINLLFESSQVEWETRSKKKKNRQASTREAESTEPTPGDDWDETPPQPTDKERPRGKSGGTPRRGSWRGKENKENERNLEDGGRPDHKDNRRRGGPGRGGPSRGRGGGRAGAGSRYLPRGGGNRSTFISSRPIDTWDSSNTWDSTTVNLQQKINADENWDDFPGPDEWCTEEYTGSLADTKVFTPSTAQEAQLEAGIDVISSSVPLDGPSVTQLAQSMDLRTQMPPQAQLSSQSPVPIVGTLNAAQTQYLSQLTQQTSENMKSAHQYGSTTGQPYSNTPQPYGTAGQAYTGQNYTASTPYNSSNVQQYGNAPMSTYNSGSYSGVTNSYGNVPEHAPPQPRKTQRARVPPPSKIPASAVEMPGDLNSSITYLDVQFGALEFMSDSNSFDGVPDGKYGNANNAVLDNSSAPNSNLDLSQSNQNLDGYAQTKSNAQSSISSALSQSLSNTDNSIPQTSEHLPSSYSATPRSSTVNATSTTPSSLDLNKQTADVHSYTQSSTYNSYQPKTSSYQAPSYNSSNYNAPQTTSNSYVSNQGNNTYANSNTGTYNGPNAGNAYPNAYSTANSYQGNANAPSFPSITQANSYPVSNQTYQQNTSQVYGATTGLNSSSGFSNPNANQYNSYTTTNKLVKETVYDSTTSVSTASTTTSSVSTTSSALSLSQTTASGVKSTTTLAKNTNSVISNMPPGVAPVMSAQYIMGQVPFFQQPIYSYEDMQLLQQRIPHMTGYYDMGYQQPTTLPAVRDGTLTNVAYSISDGRFTRGDNASPVPSTISQQTSTLSQGHQTQPMLAQTAGPPYFFAAAYNPMQPSYAQFGAVYPQLPAVTNAHGSSNSSQYPKPATYGSSYGSGYEPLTQSQDYSKGGYVGNTQGQNKGTGANASSTGGSNTNDLSAMYGKSHAALGKVNSYEKQGFHSGTPPPFTAGLHANQNAGLAPSGTGYGPQMYIPTMAPHQQHHTTPLIHQPLHQMEVRHQGRRMDSGSSSGQRSQTSSQAKSGAKQGYPTSYWNQA